MTVVTHEKFGEGSILQLTETTADVLFAHGVEVDLNRDTLKENTITEAVDDSKVHEKLKTFMTDHGFTRKSSEHPKTNASTLFPKRDKNVGIHSYENGKGYKVTVTHNHTNDSHDIKLHYPATDKDPAAIYAHKYYNPSTGYGIPAPFKDRVAKIHAMKEDTFLVDAPFTLDEDVIAEAKALDDSMVHSELKDKLNAHGFVHKLSFHPVNTKRRVMAPADEKIIKHVTHHAYGKGDHTIYVSTFKRSNYGADSEHRLSVPPAPDNQMGHTNIYSYSPVKHGDAMPSKFVKHLEKDHPIKEETMDTEHEDYVTEDVVIAAILEDLMAFFKEEEEKRGRGRPKGASEQASRSFLDQLGHVADNVKGAKVKFDDGTEHELRRPEAHKALLHFQRPHNEQPEAKRAYAAKLAKSKSHFYDALKTGRGDPEPDKKISLGRGQSYNQTQKTIEDTREHSSLISNSNRDFDLEDVISEILMKNRDVYKELEEASRIKHVNLDE